MCAHMNALILSTYVHICMCAYVHTLAVLDNHENIVELFTFMGSTTSSTGAVQPNTFGYSCGKASRLKLRESSESTATSLNLETILDVYLHDGIYRSLHTILSIIIW
ncbi:hypothetical protein O6H91_Y431100 [Diphasiastrum complanatum]|nr:hypothetical protein O6H91_Y431100 [Diphasiastrum complanatum]